MKRLKDIIKQNPEPARGKSGIDPLDPWGAKAGIAEASEQQLLNQFLKSRGINPNFVSTDTKISHSKSGQFLQWKQNHEHNFREENILEATDDADVISVDIPLMIRILELAREDVKDDMELHRITERLIEIRNKGVLTMDDYDFIANVKKLKEELEDVALDQQINEVLSKDASAGDWIHDFIHSDNPKFAGKSKKERQKMALGAYYAKQNEEVEQIVEISKKTVKSWLGQQKPIPEKKPGEQRKAFNVRIKKRSKSWDGAIDRLTDRKPTSEEVNFQENKKTALDRFRAASVDREKKHNDIEKKRQEKLHQDPSKVTVPVANTNKDDMTSAIDRLEKHLNRESVQAERTKSARIIKSLYKAKGVKEETYDWEKDDKAQSYGKKPKIDKPDGQDNMDQKKPQARAVMVGGTTLTGIKRDTVEIDPLMKNVVPGQMAFDRLSKK